MIDLVIMLRCSYDGCCGIGLVAYVIYVIIAPLSIITLNYSFIGFLLVFCGLCIDCLFECFGRLLIWCLF